MIRSLVSARHLGHSQAMPSPSRSRWGPNPGSPRRIGAACAARTAVQFRYETLPFPELAEPVLLFDPEDGPPPAGARTGFLALASSAAGGRASRGRSAGAGGAGVRPGVDASAGTGGTEPVEAAAAEGDTVPGTGTPAPAAAGAGGGAVTVTVAAGTGRGPASSCTGCGPRPARTRTANQIDAKTTVTARPALSQRAMNASAAPNGGTTRVATTTAGTASRGCQRRGGTWAGRVLSGGGYTRLQTGSSPCRGIGGSTPGQRAAHPRSTGTTGNLRGRATPAGPAGCSGQEPGTTPLQLGWRGRGAVGRGQAAARLIWSLKITQRWPRSALSQGLVERFGVFQALAKQ